MKKLIIVGAGITGLSAGIHALLKGYKVTIYEKNDFAGGCATGWFKNEYYIENCMHWLTGTNQATKDFKLWKKVGALDETSNLYQAKYFYKSTDKTDQLCLYPDTERLRIEMLKLSKDDAKEINKFINAVNAMIKINQDHSFISNIINKLNTYPKAILKYQRLTLEDLKKRFKHPLIQKMLTDYFPKEYSSLALIYAYATFASGNGKVYLEGSKAFSYNILNKFLSLGGDIEYNSEITNVNIISNTVDSVIINNKDVVKCDAIIYTGDPKYLFSNILDESYMPKYLKSKFDDLKQNPIYSSYHAAFIAEKIFSPITEAVVIDIPDTKVGNRTINRLFIKNYAYLYNNRNKTVLQIFIPQDTSDYIYWENLKKESLEKYNAAKTEVAKILEGHLMSHFTILRDNMKLLDTWTPVTYNEYYHSYYGSYMGFTVTNKFKLTKPSNRIHGLKNFYLATYWQRLTGGLPVALTNGIEVTRYL